MVIPLAAVPQEEEATPLSLPQMKRFFEDCFVWNGSSASTAHFFVIPSHYKLTLQILSH